MAGSQVLRPTIGRLLQPASHQASCGIPSLSTRVAAFSTTAPQCKRKTKDSNKKRGVSSLYRSGPREPLSMSNIPLPKPREFKQKLQIDDNHGLWGFFPKPGKALFTPKETEEHGRGWTVEELRKKSWEDLHALWWVCCRERNMLATSKEELSRSNLGFGEQELDMRDEEVRKTMKSIKHALTERYYTWEDAVEVAKSDPEINLEAVEGELYQPSQYEDEFDATEESWTKEAAAGATSQVEGGAKEVPLEDSPVPGKEERVAPR